MTRREIVLPVLIWGLVAALLRVGFASGFEAPEPVLDQARFVALAEGLEEEGPYVSSPLYPIVISIFGEGGTRTFQWVLGVLTVMLCTFTAGKRFGARAAWITGLLLAAFGPAMHYESLLLVASSMAFLFAACLAIEPEEEESLGRGLTCGVLLGIAAALRPTALVLAPVMAAGLALRGMKRSSLTLLFGTALAVSPIALRNTLSGEPVPLTSGGGFNLWVGNHEGAPGVFQAPPGYDFALDPVGKNLACVLSEEELDHRGASAWWREQAEFSGSLFLRKLALWFHPEEIPQLGPDDFRPARTESPWLRFPVDGRLLLLLGFLAPLILPKEKRGAAWMLAAYSAVCVLFFVSGRFRYPGLPIAAVLGGGALAQLTAIDRARLTRFAGIAIALFAFTFWLYRSSGDFAMGEATSRGEEGRALAAEGRYVEAADAFRRELEDDPTLHRAALDLARLLSGPLLADDEDEKRRQWSEVVRLLGPVTSTEPTLGEAWFYLGVSQLNLKQFPLAASALEQATRNAEPGDDWSGEAQRALDVARRAARGG